MYAGERADQVHTALSVEAVEAVLRGDGDGVAERVVGVPLVVAAVRHLGTAVTV